MERRFKLCVLGSTGVGKTCLTVRFVKGVFADDQLPTIGAAYMTKKVISNQSQFIFEIWDTAGQERYEAITPLYYRSAQAAVIVFDVSEKVSFQKAKEWLKRLRRELPDSSLPIVLAGNKADTESRAVDSNEAETFAKENGLEYFETSAKTGQNVEQMFIWIAEHLPPPPSDLQDQAGFANLTSQSLSKNSSSKCC